MIRPRSRPRFRCTTVLRLGIVGVLFVACRPYVPQLRGAKIAVQIHRRVPPLADDCDFRELGDDCEIEHRKEGDGQVPIVRCTSGPEARPIATIEWCMWPELEQDKLRQYACRAGGDTSGGWVAVTHGCYRETSEGASGAARATMHVYRLRH